VERGGLNRTLAVASNTFRETVRERVLYNLLIFAVLMTVSGLVLGHLSIRQDEKIIKDLGLAAMDLFGTLIAIFVGVGLVSKEIEKRSLYPLLAKPVTRDEFLLGKFLGLGFTLAVNIAVMTLGLYATLFATRRSFEPHLLKAIYPIFLGLLVTVSLALLFSVFTNAAMAAVCTVSLVVAGRFSDVVRNMQDVAAGVAPRMARALYYAIPNYRNFDFKDAVVYGDPVRLADLGWVSLYAVTYAAVVLGAALAAFRSRDFS
jgi:ABC-type transport system involved in multi-copper enzyme maturation permease subunit